MSRKPAEILELALSYPTEHACYMTYMCWQLQRMYGQNVIDFDEFNQTKKAVLAAIDGHSTLAGYLRANNLMSRDMSMYSHQYVPVRNRFYQDLANQLRKE